MIFNLVWLPARQTGSSTRTKVLLRIMIRDTTVCEDDLVKQALRGLIVRPSNSAICCLNLGNAASILVPKTSRLTSRSSCAPDREVKSLLVYGIQPQTKPIPLVNLQ